MPFFLYQHRSGIGDSLKFRRLKRVSIGGKHGPIAAHAREECGGVPERGWHMSEIQLLDRLNVAPEHAVLIDLKPTTKSNVSLYRITDVWGFSYKEWTPVCLRLESLFIDEIRQNAEVFKEKFNFSPEGTGEIVYEFLYLNGGASEGTWQWGMSGNVNGTLLFQDAWRYLSHQVDYGSGYQCRL